MNQKKKKPYDETFHEAFKSEDKASQVLLEMRKQKNVYIVTAEKTGDRRSNSTTIYGIFTKEGLEKINNENKIKHNNVFIIPLDRWIRNGIDLRAYVAMEGKFAMTMKLKRRIKK
jgi:hypothetical protein